MRDKVAQLLAFYEASLPPEERALLGIVGLFPGEVDLDTVGLFARELAVDDAEAALALAQQCGYAWAERDGLVLRADAHHALGDTDQAHRDRADAQMLTARLQPND